MKQFQLNLKMEMCLESWCLEGRAGCRGLAGGVHSWDCHKRVALYYRLVQALDSSLESRFLFRGSIVRLKLNFTILSSLFILYKVKGGLFRKVSGLLSLTVCVRLPVYCIFTSLIKVVAGLKINIGLKHVSKVYLYPHYLPKVWGDGGGERRGGFMLISSEIFISICFIEWSQTIPNEPLTFDAIMKFIVITEAKFQTIFLL